MNGIVLVIFETPSQRRTLLVMRRFLYRIYWAMEARIAPTVRPSQVDFAETLNRLAKAKPQRWLDVGAGRSVFPWWMDAAYEKELLSSVSPVGIDLDMDSLRDHNAYRDKALASCYQMPFATESFDLASANMVAEHIGEPKQFLSELRRILRPGARFVFHTPNLDNPLLRLMSVLPDRIKVILARIIEGRKSEDVFPTVYRLNRPCDIERIASETGFRVERIDLVSTSAITATLGPLAIFELLWLRFISRPERAQMRTNIVAVLEAC